MLPDMTEAVARAVQSARQRAAQAGQAEVRPVDLLAGLVEEEEGRACSLLEQASTDITALRSTLLTPGGPAAALAMGLAPSVQRAFDEARSLARSVAAEQAVSSECLLLGLLRHADDVRTLAETHGLDFASLESAVLSAAGPPLALDTPLALVEMTERMDAARVLDAAANRAREALRVMEDYSRFCLDDVFLTGQLKELRHGLRDALDMLPGELLPQARETLRDVGTTISTEPERRRHSLGEIVQAGCKRLEEALRSLEEFGKLLAPDLGARVEQMRYRAYTIERALLVGASARDRLAGCKVHVLLTGSRCAAALDWTIAEAVAGGADVIQLREKELTDRELLERARNVRRWTRRAGVLFIVNDRPDIARLVEADGVHLGQDDMPVKDARRIVGPDLLIGVSTHSLEQLRQAILDGASYVGVGPTFPSSTKEFGEVAGVEFVRAAAAETTLPQFVIGGINGQTLAAAVAAGARRIAVSSAICQAEDPRRAAAELRALLPG